MSLILVTGAPGAGKTAVERELTARGYEAHDTDDPNHTGIAGWHNLETGEYVAGFNEIEVTEELMQTHRWQLTPEALTTFSQRAREDLIYLCGSLREPQPVIEASDHVVFLALDGDTIDHRLTVRAQIPGEVDWGKERWQVERSIERNKVLEAEYREIGAFFIDATQPIVGVVDDIVAATDR